MRWMLRGARLVDGVEDVSAGDIAIADGRIAATEAENHQPWHAIDATGMLVLPGFVEVHTHGGGGYSLHTTDEEELLAYARWLPSTGATSFLVGVVGVADGLRSGRYGQPSRPAGDTRRARNRSASIWKDPISARGVVGRTPGNGCAGPTRMKRGSSSASPKAGCA